MINTIFQILFSWTNLETSKFHLPIGGRGGRGGRIDWMALAASEKKGRGGRDGSVGRGGREGEGREETGIAEETSAGRSNRFDGPAAGDAPELDGPAKLGAVGTQLVAGEGARAAE
jgi:hypothetical protein